MSHQKQPTQHNRFIKWFSCYRLIVSFIIVLIVIFISVCIYHWQQVASGCFAYPPPGGTPDQKLPVNQQPCSGVDLKTTTINDFPEFLGKGRRQTVDHLQLDPDWQKNPPKQLWHQKIGAGWSAFSIVNGLAVTMEQRGEQEQVTCYSLLTGKHHWTAAWKTRFVICGVGPRSTPTINDGNVYALGAWGHLACINGQTGKIIWERELLKDLNLHWSDENRAIKFGRSNSPLVTDSLVIVPAGGLSGKESSLIAYDKNTGKPVWRGGNQQISYSSPILAEFFGKEQILIVNERTVSGHSPETGEELWSYPWPGRSNNNANVSQPVPIGNNRIFLSKGYRHGAAVIELSQHQDGRIKAEKKWHNSSVLRTKFTNVVIWQNHAFGLSEGTLECVDLATGKSRWKQGRYGHGQILRVRDMLLVLSEQGDLFSIKLDTRKPNQVKGRLKVLTGKTWNNIALFGPYLLVRNAEEAVCYKLTTK